MYYLGIGYHHFVSAWYDACGSDDFVVFEGDDKFMWFQCFVTCKVKSMTNFDTAVDELQLAFKKFNLYEFKSPALERKPLQIQIDQNIAGSSTLRYLLAS